jgi:hypothetical protein
MSNSLTPSLIAFIELYLPLSTFIGLYLGKTATLQEVGVGDCALPALRRLGE